MALATLGKTVGRMFSDRGPQRRLLLGAPLLMARVDRTAGNFFAGCLAQACQHEAPNDVRAPGRTRQRRQALRLQFTYPVSWVAFLCK